MKKMNMTELRNVNGGYSVSHTAYCEVCGKAYTSKITYYWYQVLKVSLFKSTVQENARKKALECGVRDLGF